MIFSPNTWFWSVAGSETQVFSSERGVYVPVSDSVFAAWVAAGNAPTGIASEAELLTVLQQQAPGTHPRFPLALESYAKAKWASVIANGKVTVGGFKSQTDDLSRNLISGAIQLAGKSPPTPIKWDGMTLISGAQVTALGIAVAQFVQDAFNAYGDVSSKIADGSISTFSQIDAAAWPANS